MNCRTGFNILLEGMQFDFEKVLRSRLMSDDFLLKFSIFKNILFWNPFFISLKKIASGNYHPLISRIKDQNLRIEAQDQSFIQIMLGRKEYHRVTKRRYPDQGIEYLLSIVSD